MSYRRRKDALPLDWQGLLVSGGAIVTAVMFIWLLAEVGEYAAVPAARAEEIHR